MKRERYACFDFNEMKNLLMMGVEWNGGGFWSVGLHSVETLKRENLISNIHQSVKENGKTR
jgi:hypothetical protein